MWSLIEFHALDSPPLSVSRLKKETTHPGLYEPYGKPSINNRGGNFRPGWQNASIQVFRSIGSSTPGSGSSGSKSRVIARKY